MKRQVFSALTSLTLIISGFVPAYASSGSVTVLVNGNQLDFDQTPILTDSGRTLVPLRGVFEALKADVSWDNATQTVTVKKDNSTILLKIGSPFAEKDGQSILLDVSPQLVHNRTLVPLRFVGESLGATVSWNGQSQIASVSLADTANSSTPAEQTFTPQQAVDKAISTSITIQNAQADIDRAKLVRDRAYDNISFIPSTGGNAEASKSLTGYNQSEINYQMTQKTMDIKKDTLSFSTKNAYYAVLEAIQQRELANMSLDYESLQKQIVETKNSLGAASEYDVSQENSKYTSAREKQQQANKSLDNAYIQLNQLLGLPSNARPYLVDTPKLIKLADDDKALETHISQILSDSASVWMAEQNVKLKELGLQLYTFNDKSVSDPYEAKQIDVDKAQSTLTDTKNTLDKSLRSIYTNIKLLEDKYAEQLAAVSSAEDNLNLIKQKYEVGMAVKSDFEGAQLGLANAKSALLDTIVKHETLVIQYNQPWVSGGGSDPSSSQ